MTREELRDIIFSIRTRENISNEILEKDYYVKRIIQKTKLIKSIF